MKMTSVLVKRADRRIAEPPLTSVIKVRNERHDAQIIDLCRKGLRFKSETQYRNGDTLKFGLQNVEDSPPLSLSIKAKVINSYGRDDEGLYEYGVKFTKLSYWYEINCIHNYIYSNQKA